MGVTQSTLREVWASIANDAGCHRHLGCRSSSQADPKVFDDFTLCHTTDMQKARKKGRGRLRDAQLKAWKGPSIRKARGQPQNVRLSIQRANHRCSNSPTGEDIAYSSPACYIEQIHIIIYIIFICIISPYSSYYSCRFYLLHMGYMYRYISTKYRFSYLHVNVFMLFLCNRLGCYILYLHQWESLSTCGWPSVCSTRHAGAALLLLQWTAPSMAWPVLLGLWIGHFSPSYSFSSAGMPFACWRHNSA